jgi:hypothetical protein
MELPNYLSQNAENLLEREEIIFPLSTICNLVVFVLHSVAYSLIEAAKLIFTWVITPNTPNSLSYVSLNYKVGC